MRFIERRVAHETVLKQKHLMHVEVRLLQTYAGRRN
jgi:hypothetical protein